MTGPIPRRETGRIGATDGFDMIIIESSTEGMV